MTRMWMLYGANGYSAQLIVELANKKKLSPILAGRSVEKIAPLAKQWNLDYRCFDLADMSSVRKNLQDIKLVLNCAGPFSQTHQPFLKVCPQTKTHYLDITGEIDVFESFFAASDQAQASGIVFMPGVGFDVVPSDCLARSLFERLPDAQELHLAFRSSGKISPGTMKTAIEDLGKPLRVRRNGKIVASESRPQREVPFNSRTKVVTAIPWGDVSTAFHSTGIPNITTYTTLPPGMERAQKVLRVVGQMIGRKRMENFLKRQVEKHVKGPNEEERAATRVYLWGMVKNRKQQMVQAQLDVPEGYTFTADAALASVQKILAGIGKSGALTPSLAFGADFVHSLSDVSDLKWLP